ncbi:uncharacterized protein LOC111045459 isoform X5 [Nilaparvata lugens]|uniref:uncharacterized protein LOC111045459 isoform X5 n=1 Tax=Nilaparvata lugens TaxID=108931 RepID=UPI00193C97BF|nr:uncharacterized protein LOC111045459 isoform X5 [Nilaparvata lugens]
MTDFSEQRSCIKLCFELGKSATETLGVLRSIYGENALCRSKTFHWYSRFRDGQIPTGKPVASKDSTPSDNATLKPNARKRRKNSLENPEAPHNIHFEAIEAQLNYVKMLMRLGKSPSETYTCMQALFGPNSISRIDLLQLFLKLEAEDKLANTILPPIIKPPTKRQRTSLPATQTVRESETKPATKRLSQSRVDLMTGGSFWQAPYNDEKENTSLTENQVCFMDHFMLSGDSNRDSFKIMLPKNGGDGYQDDVYVNGVDRFVPLPVPVENLNRMHVMDGDCSKADIVAEKAPQLQLDSPAAEAAANGHDAVVEQVVKPSLKEVVTMKEPPQLKDTDPATGEVAESENDTSKSNGEALEEDKGPVVNGSDSALVTSDEKPAENSSDSDAILVNGDSNVADDENGVEKMVVDEEKEEPKLENGVGDAPMSTEEEVVKMVEDSAVKKEEEEEECVEKEEDVVEKDVAEEVKKVVAKEEEEKKEEEEQTSEASSKKEETRAEERGGTAVSEEDEERTNVTSSQSRKRRLADTNGEAENCDNEAEGEAEMEGEAEGEGEVEGEGSSSDSESGTKRQRVEVEGEDERERLVREYVERCTQSVEEMSRNADKLQREIGALGELARAKELEWNSILRLRKLKEEMLERLLRRRRQTMMLADNGLAHDWATDFNKSKVSETTKANSNNHLMMVPIVSSSPGNNNTSLGSTGSGGAMSRAAAAILSQSPDTTRLARLQQRPILPKPASAAAAAAAAAAHLIDQQNTVIGEGRQGPILDVKSIIADYSGYRSRHPADNVPRRGRRMKPGAVGVGAVGSVTSTHRITGSPALMSMANMALCSGAHIRNNAQDCGTGQENSRPSSTDSTRSANMQSESTASNTTTLPAPGLNFKDVLVQFAKMSQPPAAVTSLLPSHHPSKTHPHPPPPYPEVTLHPVPAPQSHNSPSPPTSTSHTSSLLHGILTKSATNPAHNQGAGSASSTTTSSASHRPTTFSPTLARLLTAPERERGGGGGSVATSHHMSASAVNASHFRPPVSRVSISDLLTTSKEDDPEETDSTDRLVIDESAGGVDQKEGAEGEGGGEGEGESVPECQGCQQRAAQFVCAGCGNQWYCSRECQVTAWEEHSEMCSG